MKITDIKPGRVFFHDTEKYGLTAFVKIEDFETGLTCSECGSNVWNANNFSGHVHFCINKDYKFWVTDWAAEKK